jgi:DNA-binding response OmpR family regulator
LLIVEDHHDIRAALRRLLVHRGWHVLEAATVAEALALLDPPPDCVILDLMLPDGDGETVLLKIRAEQLAIRVFIYTASYDPVRLGDVSSVGPDGVFLKPTGFAGLLQACGTPA